MTTQTQEYPTDFASSLEYVKIEELAPIGRYAGRELLKAGYQVSVGLRRIDVADITRIANQPGVGEYCPSDALSRFSDPDTTRQWMEEKGGRAMFLLRDTAAYHRIAGYGWVGPGRVPEIPGTALTFAVRLDAAHGGKGLGKLFTQSIVEGARANYRASSIGLETWASNGAAGTSYLRAGAILLGMRTGRRSTLDPRLQDDQGKVQDTRLFMRFPHPITQ
jgi:hypothetical protein